LPESTERRPDKPGNICDNCHQRPAEFSFTSVDKEGRKIDVKLCGACARQQGLLPAQMNEVQSLATVLEELKSRVQDADNALVCPRCRLSYADFKKTLRLGCENCYAAFGERLMPILKRVHNATRHTGHIPQPGKNTARDFEVQRLRRELRRAIEAEDYERAAAVRDRIKNAGEEP
jgi:protein arginine kinase activator